MNKNDASVYEPWVKGKRKTEYYWNDKGNFLKLDWTKELDMRRNPKNNLFYFRTGNHKTKQEELKKRQWNKAILKRNFIEKRSEDV